MSEQPDAPVRKTVSLPASLWKQIEDFQFEHRIKRDAEAVRTLIQRGLEAGGEVAKPRRAIGVLGLSNSAVTGRLRR